MMCLVNFVFALSQLQGALSGDGLVGGNPTMNTPRLRRGGGIAPSSNLFILSVLVLLNCILVCVSTSEFGAMGSILPFWGFLALTCFLFF